MRSSDGDDDDDDNTNNNNVIHINNLNYLGSAISCQNKKDITVKI